MTLSTCPALPYCVMVAPWLLHSFSCAFPLCPSIHLFGESASGFKKFFRLLLSLSMTSPSHDESKPYLRTHTTHHNTSPTNLRTYRQKYRRSIRVTSTSKLRVSPYTQAPSFSASPHTETIMGDTSCFCCGCVSTGEVGIVERNCKYNRLAMPGITLMCWPFEVSELELFCSVIERGGLSKTRARHFILLHVNHCFEGLHGHTPCVLFYQVSSFICSKLAKDA